MDEQKIRKIVQDEMRRGASKGRFGLQMPQNHAHTGVDGSPQIRQENIIPSVSVAGSITFQQIGTYTLNLNSSFTPSHIFAHGTVTDGGTRTFAVSGGGGATATAGAVYENNGQTFTVLNTASGDPTLVTTLGSGVPNPSGVLSLVSGTGNGTIAYSSFSTSGSFTRRCLTVGSASLGPSFYFQPGDSRTVITGNIQYPLATEQPDGSKANVPVQGSSYISVTNAGVVRALTSQFHIVDIEDTSIHARATVVGYTKTAVLISVPYLDPGWQIIANYVIT